MSYTVNYFDLSGLIGAEANISRFSAAKALAEKAVSSRCAEWVEVRDSDDRLVHKRPRTVRGG